jgi:hypothetical protein
MSMIDFHLICLVFEFVRTEKLSHDLSDGEIEEEIEGVRRRRHEGGRRGSHQCIIDGCHRVTGEIKRHLMQFHRMNDLQARRAIAEAKGKNCV